MLRTRGLCRAMSLSVCIATASFGLAGCTPARSVQAYCQAVAQHKARYLAAMSQASSENTLASLLDGSTAIADLKSMWDDLATVAPSDIETDTDSVRDAWDKITDDANNRNWFAAIAVSLENARPMERVNRYIGAHCGVDAAPVGTRKVQTGTSMAPSSAAPSATVSASPSLDPTLTAVDVSGYASKFWEYGPHAVLSTHGDGTFSAVAVAQGALVSSSITPSETGTDAELEQTVGGVQQEADAAPDFLIATYSHQPSSGLNPEKWIAALQRYRADGSAEGAPATVPVCSVDGCTIGSIALIGDVGVVSYSGNNGYGTTSVDLSTGRVVWTADNTELLDEDNSLAILDVSTSTSVERGISAINAQTGATAWSITDAQHIDRDYQRLAPDLALIETAGRASDGYATRLHIVDLRSGAPPVPRYGDMGLSAVAFDASTSRIVMTNVASTSDDFDAKRTQLETLDLSGKTVFSIPAAQYAALDDPSVIAVTDGEMWIKDQNGLDEIDASTGVQSATSPQKTGSTAPVSLPLVFDDSVALVTTKSPTEADRTTLVVSAVGSPTAAQIATATNN